MTGDGLAGAAEGAASSDLTPWVRVREIMGTVVSIHAMLPAGSSSPTDPRIPAAADAAFDLLHEVDRVFTTYSEDSDIRRMARGELQVSDANPMVTEVVALALQARRATHGLVDAWWRGWFDPTGVVKGWAVERAARRYVVPLIDEGVAEAVAVSAGGDMQLATSPTSSWTWNVGIADPFHAGATIARIPVRSGAVATSGTAERGAHITDPRSGEPTVSVASASVVASSLTTADLWATAACVAGFDDLTWIEVAGTQSGMLVAADGRVRRWAGDAEVAGGTV